MNQTVAKSRTLLIQLPEPITFDFGALLKKRMSDDEFLEFSKRNEGWRVEMNQYGDLVIMPGTGGRTGKRNSRLTRRLDEWAELDGTGESFNSETCFTLPNGARRMPDAAWVTKTKWEALTETQQDKPLPLAPDFAGELRSPSDSLRELQEKMEEYRTNGVSLGWLIDPQHKRVHIYRPGAEVEVLDNPQTVSGEPLLKGFVLNLAEIWG